MAQKCAACGSVDTEALFKFFACLTCGAVSSFDGKVVPDAVDAHVRAAAPEVVAPETVVP